MNKRKRVSRIIAVALVAAAGTLLLLILLATPARPARADPDMLCVAPNGVGCSSPCGATCYASVQDAVDSASSGDEIRVATGVYTTNGQSQVVLVDETVTIRGGYTTADWDTSDPDANPTTLDAEGQGRVVYITGDITPTIDGFVITGGNGSNVTVGAQGSGGGIYSTGATPIIANNVIVNNTAYTSTSDWGYGGGICVSNPPGAAVITGNHVLSNVASTSYRGYGGGIHLESAPLAQVMNNVVLSNTASITGGRGYGGGIAFRGSDDAVVAGNRVEHNVGQGGLATRFGSRGGGIYCYDSNSATLSSNVVRYNTASVPANGNGGGIGINWCQRLTVVGNTLQGNVGAGITGRGWGGGLGAYASRDLAITANQVLSNTASLSESGWGGGFYLSRNTWFTMTNNIVAANHASYRGGGLVFETSASEPVTGTLLHNTFAANDRGSGDGRIAIHLNDPYVTLVLTNNLIYSHTYGIYATTVSTATLHNTLFYANSSGDTGGPGVIANTNPITGQDPLLDADYHLQAGSPAIDAGANAGVTTDIDGDTRPIGPLPDIGADEAVPAITVAKTGPAKVTIGTPITYTLHVSNTGVVTAYSVVLTDALPAGANFVRASDGGYESSGVISWPTFNVPPDGGIVARTFTVTATEPITNADYQATAQGLPGVAGTVAIVTTIEHYRIYLPLTLRNYQ